VESHLDQRIDGLEQSQKSLHSKLDQLYVEMRQFKAMLQFTVAERQPRPPFLAPPQQVIPPEASPFANLERPAYVEQVPGSLIGKPVVAPMNTSISTPPGPSEAPMPTAQMAQPTPSIEEQLLQDSDAGPVVERFCAKRRQGSTTAQPGTGANLWIGHAQTADPPMQPSSSWTASRSATAMQTTVTTSAGDTVSHTHVSSTGSWSQLDAPTSEEPPVQHSQTFVSIQQEHDSPRDCESSISSLNDCVYATVHSHANTESVERMSVMHADVRLSDGRLALCADIGSKGNVCGQDWADKAIALCHEHGMPGQYKDRARPLDVEGVGDGAQRCTQDVSVAGAIPTKGDRPALRVIYHAPVIPNSQIPALLGLETLSKMKALINCATHEIHFLGPDDSKSLDLPEGTVTLQAELSKSGHMMIPFGEFKQLSNTKKLDEKQISLNTNTKSVRFTERTNVSE
jgi:hypothetical protein